MLQFLQEHLQHIGPAQPCNHYFKEYQHSNNIKYHIINDLLIHCTRCTQNHTLNFKAPAVFGPIEKLHNYSEVNVNMSLKTRKNAIIPVAATLRWRKTDMQTLYGHHIKTNDISIY